MSVILGTDEKMRCSWCGTDELYQQYHDHEWGKPTYDELELFEMLLLEGAQAGLSWITVLRKRAHYRIVFDGFDPEKIARYDEQKRMELLSDPGIIRNKLKVNAFIVNAQLFLQMKENGESFSEYIWSFTGNQIMDRQLGHKNQYTATTKESDAMSKDLKKRGFKFTGSTICLAYMEACGMVNDHYMNCWTRNS